jgi:hypothetical protein
MLKDLEEVWMQNSMTEGTDRVSTIRELVRVESAVAFETAFLDAKTTEEGYMAPISLDNFIQALEAVTLTIFRHYYALKNQRLWMNRKTFKPSELSTRQIDSPINHLNYV